MSLSEFHQIRKQKFCEQYEGRGLVLGLNNFVYTEKPFAALTHVNDNHEIRFWYPTANSGNFDEYLVPNDAFKWSKAAVLDTPLKMD